MLERTAFLVTFLSCSFASAQEVSTEPLGEVQIGTSFAHDELAGKLRRHRAHGADAVLNVTVRPRAWRAGELLDDFSVGLGAHLGWTARFPTDARQPRPQPHDLAPNGYLYGGFHADLLGREDRLTPRYAIGATGEDSHAGSLYRSLGRENSWGEHVAEGEIAQNLWFTWEHAWLQAMPTSRGTHLVDVTSTATTALGERRVSQTFALETRAGWLLGPMNGTTSVRGDDWGSNAEAYVHASLGLDLVAHNAMVDGPFFNDEPHPHQVDSRVFVPFATMGVMVRPWRNAGIGYALDLRGADTQSRLPEGPSTDPSVTGRFDLELNF